MHQGKEPEWFLANPPPWEVAEEQLELNITRIEQECGATEPSIYFFTGKTNFRNLIAKRKPYKVRKESKPFHYYNITAYLKGKYDCRQTEGLEADDLLAIHQESRRGKWDTIISTLDKDLAQVDGWHHRPEVGQRAGFGPLFVDGYGSINLSKDKKTIKGFGTKFFLSQCLTGDVVDSIPGLPKCGPVKAWDVLGATTTYDEGVEAVLGAYEAFYGHPVIAREELLEQGRLLWMTRQLNEDGSPVLWQV